jgi:MerR family transcriptional regulator, light-induced transcriptional regulator
MSMKNSMSREEPQYPINYVARLTGLSAHAIRMWERRHDVVKPARAASGHRLYSDGQIDRLKLLRRATVAGHPIGKVSSLPDDELRAIVRGELRLHEGALESLPRESTPGAPYADILTKCFDAVAGLDREQLDTILAQCSVKMACMETLEHIITPLMQWVGSRWHDGTLQIAHEHLATASVRAHLERLSVSIKSEGNGRSVMLTTLPGQRHEMGILMCAVVAAVEGWRCHYFGTEMPPADIAQAATAMGASMVAVGAPGVGDERELYEQLTELRELLPSGVRLIVGGAGAATLSENLEPRGIQWIEDVGLFQKLLNTT